MSKNPGQEARERLLKSGFSDDAIRRIFDAGAAFYANCGTRWFFELFDSASKKPGKRRALHWILLRLLDLNDTSDWEERIEVMKLLGGTLPHQPNSEPWTEIRLLKFLGVVKVAFDKKFAHDPQTDEANHETER